MLQVPISRAGPECRVLNGPWGVLVVMGSIRSCEKLMVRGVERYRYLHVAWSKLSPDSAGGSGSEQVRCDVESGGPLRPPVQKDVPFLFLPEAVRSGFVSAAV